MKARKCKIDDGFKPYEFVIGVETKEEESILKYMFGLNVTIPKILKKENVGDCERIKAILEVLHDGIHKK